MTFKRLTITPIHLRKQTFPWAMIEKILRSVRAVTEFWNAKCQKIGDSYFLSYLVGVWFRDLASYSKAVIVDRSLWKISHHGKLIWLEFAETVDKFHFSVPFSEVFLSGSVCVQLSTFPSFALWPSTKTFSGNDMK